MLAADCAAAAPPPEPSAPQDSQQLAEVRIIASKLDRRTLKRVTQKFVESHAAENPVVHQLGRWQQALCPQLTGLKTGASAFIVDHIQEVARSVGAPSHAVGKKCSINVEIVFTGEPQHLLDHIAKDYPILLGSSRKAGDTTFGHAIQSWYLTGTRSMAGFQPPIDGTALYMALFDPSQVGNFTTPDPAYGSGAPPSGLAGSRLTKSLQSELLHVFIIVDAQKVAGESLRAIADYIAMVALTRMGSLDACSELSSIIDLLSPTCTGRDKPVALTGADTAYLKALYSSDLETNLNIEQGDMRDRMIKVIEGE